MRVLFSVRLLSETFHILRRVQLDIMYVGLHVKYLLYLQGLMKLEFLDTFSKNTANIKYHKNPSSGRRVVHVEGRTAR
jgi:hypothetical protein